MATATVTANLGVETPILFIKTFVYGYSERERVEECAQEYEQARKTGKKKKAGKATENAPPVQSASPSL